MTSRDRMQQRGKYGKVMEEDDGRKRTIIGVDRETKWISAIVFKRERIDPSAAEAVGGDRGGRVDWRTGR